MNGQPRDHKENRLARNSSWPDNALFSFGLVIFEMATGQSAFSGDTAPILQDAILKQAPPRAKELNAEVPPHLQEIIDKALEKDRGLRFRAHPRCEPICSN